MKEKSTEHQRAKETMSSRRQEARGSNVEKCNYKLGKKAVLRRFLSRGSGRCALLKETESIEESTQSFKARDNPFHSAARETEEQLLYAFYHEIALWQVFEL